jgi:hypothetical protein
MATEQDRKIQLLLADVIDELAAAEQKIEKLSFALSVLKEAVVNHDSTGRFEAQYQRIEKILASKSQSTTQPGPKLALLLQIAQALRRED